MIEVSHIYKRYGATVAVNDVSFKVGKGEILGFLGPNGAGKSTTLKILTGYIVADSGKVTVDGLDVLEQSLEVRKRIGYLPESTMLYSDMRVIDFLRFVGRARQVPPEKLQAGIDRVVQITGIERYLKKNVGHLSKGYRQRVGLAQALVHDPEILILDEPTSGLDPHQIIEIREVIRDLGKTKVIMFSSHILQEISAICTRIIIIKDGKLIADGAPKELQDRAEAGRSYRVRVKGPAEAVKSRLAALSGVETARLLDGTGEFAEYQVKGAAEDDLGPRIYQAAKEGGWTLAHLAPDARSLEQVYLQLTETK